MKPLKLTEEMQKSARRCVWFEPPEVAIQNPARLTAYVLTHGMPEDTKALRDQLSDDDLKQALDEAPPGIYDPRSWAYWNLVVGRYDTPALPTRDFH
jgi:pyoverdine/dityrosine biosynthesis protein Dit1